MPIYLSFLRVVLTGSRKIFIVRVQIPFSGGFAPRMRVDRLLPGLRNVLVLDSVEACRFELPVILHKSEEDAILGNGRGASLDVGASVVVKVGAGKGAVLRRG